MTAFLDISAALDGHLAGMTDLPEVAWPNKEFDPTKGTLFIRPTVIMGDTVGGTLGADIEDFYSGFYQVDVSAPAGEGKNEAILMADKIADKFKRDTIITENGREIHCLHSTPLSPNNDGTWYVIPVQINFDVLTAERT